MTLNQNITVMHCSLFVFLIFIWNLVIGMWITQFVFCQCWNMFYFNWYLYIATKRRWIIMNNVLFKIVNKFIFVFCKEYLVKFSIQIEKYCLFTLLLYYFSSPFYLVITQSCHCPFTCVLFKIDACVNCINDFEGYC